MKMGFRWFGSDDYKLEYIKQIPNTKEVVWSLHDKMPGEVWEEDEIKDEVDKIKRVGLEIHVVESVNVHEDIKLGKDTRDKYIDNYIKTIEKLGKCGVEVICYNFMPLFDWMRTDLFKELDDGSTSMYFDYDVIKAIEPQKLTDSMLEIAKDYNLPGWEPERLAIVEDLFLEYNKISRDDLWGNLAYFLNRIMPTCDKYNIKMAIHPDDPGFEIFGLPRMISCEEDIKRYLNLVPSLNNGITFCTGSLGTNKENDLNDLLKKYINRIYFVHLRNLKYSKERNFQEVSHYNSDGNIGILKLVKTLTDMDYQYYIRPDHGRHIFDEISRPGYGLYDRALGIMYINGLYDMRKEDQRYEN